MTDHQTLRTFLPLLGAALLSLFWGSGVVAQDMWSPKLDLESAVARALETDPAIRGSRAMLNIAEERVWEARAGRRPTIQLEQSFIRSNNPVHVFSSLLEQGRFEAKNFSLDSLNKPAALNSFRTAVTVQMPIFDQGQTRSRLNLATIEKSSADLRIEAASQNLRFKVIRVYYSALLADHLLQATNAAVRSAKENSRKTHDFVEVGMVAESDSLAANVELANVELVGLEAQGAVIKTRAELNVAIGEKPGKLYQLIGSLQEQYFPAEEESELIRIAMNQRPDYQLSLLGIENGREKTRSIRNERLPRLVAFANFGYSSPHVAGGSTDYSFGAKFTYTIFDAGRESRLAQSAHAESASSAEKDRLENQITLEVITAAQDHKTANAKIHASIKSVIQATEALKILQDRYKAAISTFDSVLRAEAALLRAEQELLKAKYEYYISYAAILLATGRLTDVSAFNH